MMKINLLTQRERDLYNLLTTTSMDIKTMADYLGIKQQTIKTHCRNIYDKLCVNNRIELLIELLNELKH